MPAFSGCLPQTVANALRAEGVSEADVTAWLKRWHTRGDINSAHTASKLVWERRMARARRTAIEAKNFFLRSELYMSSALATRTRAITVALLDVCDQQEGKLVEHAWTEGALLSEVEGLKKALRTALSQGAGASPAID